MAPKYERPDRADRPRALPRTPLELSMDLKEGCPHNPWLMVKTRDMTGKPIAGIKRPKHACGQCREHAFYEAMLCVAKRARKEGIDYVLEALKEYKCGDGINHLSSGYTGRAT